MCSKKIKFLEGTTNFSRKNTFNEERNSNWLAESTFGGLWTWSSTRDEWRVVSYHSTPTNTCPSTTSCPLQGLRGPLWRNSNGTWGKLNCMEEPWDCHHRTWHMVFHWDFLPFSYIIELWVLILYLLLLVIVLAEALLLCTLFKSFNKNTLGVYSWVFFLWSMVHCELLV